MDKSELLDRLNVVLDFINEKDFSMAFDEIEALYDELDGETDD